MQIFNPTDETMEAMVGGVPYNFLPETILSVEDKSAANHIINEYGNRGLVVLEFGDDSHEVDGELIIETKGKAGLKKNQLFRRAQVIAHNQDNEARKQTMRAYVSPSAQIKEYAQSLGIKLISPYEVDDVNAKDLMALKKENADLAALVKEQSTLVAQLVERMDKEKEKPKRQSRKNKRGSEAEQGALPSS